MAKSDSIAGQYQITIITDDDQKAAKVDPDPARVGRGSKISFTSKHSGRKAGFTLQLAFPGKIICDPSGGGRSLNNLKLLSNNTVSAMTCKGVPAGTYKYKVSLIDGDGSSIDLAAPSLIFNGD